MNWLQRFYWKFWFYTEFWIANKLHRRPYTFIFRDWIYTHAIAATILTVIWFVGMIVLSFWYGTLSTVLSIVTGILFAHLCFGSKWIEGQQEYPQYLGD